MSATELPEVEQLEGLAREVFGAGDRPPGWFGRKLRREQVDPGLSPVAVRAGAEPSDPASWLGYVLVGTPPSRGDAVRTAGTGVRPSARGQGVGGRLLEDAALRAAAAGYRRVELWAEASVVPFYARHGFAPVLETVTALAFACGPATGPATGPAREPPPSWHALRPGEREAVAWLPEAWLGTDEASRHGLRWPHPEGPATAWVSREGLAWLVQRLVAPTQTPLPALAAALLQRLPAPAPVLLPQLPASAPETVALLGSGSGSGAAVGAGWSIAQRAVLLERRL